jgi:hypothetical protein
VNLFSQLRRLAKRPESVLECYVHETILTWNFGLRRRRR